MHHQKSVHSNSATALASNREIDILTATALEAFPPPVLDRSLVNAEALSPTFNVPVILTPDDARAEFTSASRELSVNPLIFVAPAVAWALLNFSNIQVNFATPAAS